jgi:hypothetical protein
MKKTIATFILVCLAVAASAELSRDKGLSLHMLPKRVADLSGSKWGFTIKLPDGSKPDKTLQSATELKTYFTSLSPEIQENGIWIVTTHPDSYSDVETQVLDDVKTMCIENSIPLFTCRGSELPNGWQRIDKSPKK